MHPMDFEEFCLAFQENDKCSLLRNLLKGRSSMSESIHRKLMDDFRLYLALGGMPKVISLYMETQSFLRCNKEKKDILKLYEDDLRKHDNICKTICLPLYQSMFSSLHSWSKTIKTGIANESQKNLFQRSMKDLEDSKIVNAVKRTPDLALGGSFPDETKVKLYPMDTGLMLSQLLEEGDDTIEDAYKRIRFGKLSGSNLGSLYECIVCQSLIAEDIHPNYHVFEMEKEGKTNRYELDFTYSKKGRIHAVEVKSTTRFEAPSIHKVNEKYPHLKIERTIVSPKALSYQENILNLPIYMSFLIGEDHI